MTDSNETGYDQRSGPTDDYRHSYDPATDSVSEELLLAVAAVTDTDPAELDVLADVVDPEALDAIFPADDGDPFDVAGSVTFDYEGCRIQIRRDGTITITPWSAAGDD